MLLRLQSSPAGVGHAVHFYDGGALPEAWVADFLWEGLQVDEGAVIFAVPEHAAALRHRLVARGVALDTVERTGLLQTHDAREIVNQLLQDELLAPSRRKLAARCLDGVQE